MRGWDERGKGAGHEGWIKERGEKVTGWGIKHKIF
jgi:hypothetical protein